MNRTSELKLFRSWLDSSELSHRSALSIRLKLAPGKLLEWQGDEASGKKSKQWKCRCACLASTKCFGAAIGALEPFNLDGQEKNQYRPAEVQCKRHTTIADRSHLRVVASGVRLFYLASGRQGKQGKQGKQAGRKQGKRANATCWFLLCPFYLICTLAGRRAGEPASQKLWA